MMEERLNRRQFVKYSTASMAMLSLGARSVHAEDGGQPTRADVVVYGATPAGIMAAVAAGRQGASVALVEPLGLVGGVVSSGMGFSDSNQTCRTLLRGLFEEFHLRMEKHYERQGVDLPYRVAEKDQSPWTYEPHVAHRVFKAMLEEAGVRVFLNETLASASVEQRRIGTITMRSGRRFTGHTFVDGSYEGDLLAEAGVSFRVGREAREEFDESLAGARYSKGSIPIDARGQDGKPLPLVTGAERPAPGTGDGKVMVYNFRICVSADPDNQVPFPEPDRYDPPRFELLRRYLKSGPRTGRVFDYYKLPNGKFDLNNGIGLQISMGLPGAQWAWPTASHRDRERIWEQHTQYALQVLHFSRNDPSVPESFRKRVRSWGLPADELKPFDHWPQALYVREGRRMEGRYMMTQHDVRSDVRKDDGIGISSFPIDSHDCQRLLTDSGGFANEGTIFPKDMKGYPFGQPHDVSYRCLTPKANECRNLLVPTALSSSHVAFSSVRVEPTWMVLGQAAGTAAAQAKAADVDVQAVDVNQLRQQLRADGHVVDLELPEREEA